MIAFLGCEIGRGHPFYLDGVRRALTALGRDDLVQRNSNVFDISEGLSQWAWKSVRTAYFLAGRGGAVNALYAKTRGNLRYHEGGPLLNVLGRDLRQWAQEARIVVVDHPSIAGALSDHPGVWYVHGELIVPPESVVPTAARIIVPLEETADEVVQAGVDRDRLLVTGPCIENELLPGAQTGIAARQDRMQRAGPLTVGFFSSGAEPTHHIRAMRRAAAAVHAKGHRAIAFAVRGGRLENGLRKDAPNVERVVYSDRAELDRVTADRFSELDVIVSPPHERSNWAVALGVPFFLVGPDIGSFAPRNRSFLLKRDVAIELPTEQDAARLPVTLDALRKSGRLLQLSQNGTQLPVDGFPVMARALVAAASG